jgi:hypothetical protein
VRIKVFFESINCDSVNVSPHFVTLIKAVFESIWILLPQLVKVIMSPFAPKLELIFFAFFILARRKMGLDLFLPTGALQTGTKFEDTVPNIKVIVNRTGLFRAI